MSFIRLRQRLFGYILAQAHPRCPPISCVTWEWVSFYETYWHYLLMIEKCSILKVLIKNEYIYIHGTPILSCAIYSIFIRYMRWRYAWHVLSVSVYETLIFMHSTRIWICVNHICACSAYDTENDENLKKKHSILNLSIKFSVKNRERYQTSVTTHSQVVCANVETVFNTTFCSQIIQRKFNCYFHFEIFSVKL